MTHLKMINTECPYCGGEWQRIKLNGLPYLYCDICTGKKKNYNLFCDTRGALVCVSEEDIAVFKEKTKK